MRKGFKPIFTITTRITARLTPIEQALTWIHEQGAKLPVSEETVLQLHRLARGEIWDAGKYKEKDGDIIEKLPDGRSRVRFKTVSATDITACMNELLRLYNDALDEHRIPPLVLLASFNLDFLSIHPFRDGNGRVSRLLLLLQFQSPKGEKTTLILHAIDSTLGPFSVAELQNRCPNISVDMVRRVLKNLPLLLQSNIRLKLRRS